MRVYAACPFASFQRAGASIFGTLALPTSPSRGTKYVDILRVFVTARAGVVAGSDAPIILGRTTGIPTGGTSITPARARTADGAPDAVVLSDRTSDHTGDSAITATLASRISQIERITPEGAGETPQRVNGYELWRADRDNGILLRLVPGEAAMLICTGTAGDQYFSAQIVWGEED